MNLQSSPELEPSQSSQHLQQLETPQQLLPEKPMQSTEREVLPIPQSFLFVQALYLNLTQLACISQLFLEVRASGSSTGLPCDHRKTFRPLLHFSVQHYDATESDGA